MSGERLYPLTNPGPLVPLPEHLPAPNSEDLVDLELDRLRAENAELRRALAAVVPMAREADPTGCAAEVVEAEGALGMSVGQAMDYYRTQVEASARVELADLRAKLEASEQALSGWVGPCAHGRDPWNRCNTCGEKTAAEALFDAWCASERGAAAMKHFCEWAWTIIANAGGGNWKLEHADWREAARKWADEYHAILRKPDGGT